MIAPLQLIDYNAETLLYERRNAKSVSDDVDVGVELGFGMDASVDDERDAHCVTLFVRFNLNLDQIPEEVQPYIAHRGEVRVRGWIRWISDEMETREDAPDLLLTNGLAMLYGIARVHIAQLTDGPSADRLLVPSIRFQPMVDEWMKRDADAQDET